MPTQGNESTTDLTQLNDQVQVATSRDITKKTANITDILDSANLDGVQLGAASQLTSQDLAELENIQAELDKLQGSASSGTPTKSAAVVVEPVPGSHTPVILPQNIQAAQVSNIGAQKTDGTNKKDDSGQVVTKVIIAKAQNQNRVTSGAVNNTVSDAQVRTLLSTSSVGGLTVIPGGPGTPTKTVTISRSGIINPVTMTTMTTPTKHTVPVGKIALSPAKTPTKITMIPVSLGKSPQRIAPGTVPMVAMVAKPNTGVTQVTSSTGPRQPTITMSPSKVIIRQQPVQIAKANVGQAVTTNTKQQFTIPISSGSNAIQVPGSKFHYVRLVTNPTGQTAAVPAGTKVSSIAPMPIQARPIAPATQSSSVPQQVKITLPVQQTSNQGSSQSQRLLLPATSTVTIKPTTSAGQPVTTLAQLKPNIQGGSLANLPPGTTIISGGNTQGVSGFALVPAQYVTQIQQQLTSQPSSTATTTQQKPESNFVPIASTDPALSAAVASRHVVNGRAQPVEATGARPRKPCNCTKSQCLKLYCDCFANGEFCHNCNCTNCANNLEHEEERQKAIKSCLDRNPLAFHPKIGKGKGKGGEGDRRHQKGCNCKRSGCLKNYCECYEAKILCSANCKCVGCKNFEESPERKTLMHLADAAEVRVQQQTAAKSKLSSQIQDLPVRPQPLLSGQRLPYSFVTSEVAEATCACLLAQAEEAERGKLPEVEQERLLLEEFGRCLLQIIESANKTKMSM